MKKLLGGSHPIHGVQITTADEWQRYNRDLTAYQQETSHTYENPRKHNSDKPTK